MKIKVISKNNKQFKEFNKKEWRKANIENFGHSKDWNTKNQILGAYDDKNILIGILGIKIEGGVGYIGTMLVAKKNRKKGIGKMLMNKAKEIAQKNKAHKIYLQTGKSWESVNFYKKLGYKITGYLPNHYFNVDFVELTLFI
jgi:ribosomal protein S18 acetylase RimI-like enzyme